jgi:hypothetical protein
MFDTRQRIVYGAIERVPLWVTLVSKISHLLLGISSAANIIIYSYKVASSLPLSLSLLRGLIFTRPVRMPGALSIPCRV